MKHWIPAASVLIAFVAAILFAAAAASMGNSGRNRFNHTQETSIMGLKPINDRIIVRRKGREEKTPGGILLPDNAKEKPSRGEVLAVGPGAWNKDHTARVPVSVKVGDTVLFSKWSGADHDYKELGDIVILGESDVLAVEE